MHGMHTCSEKVQVVKCVELIKNADVDDKDVFALHQAASYCLLLLTTIIPRMM